MPTTKVFDDCIDRFWSHETATTSNLHYITSLTRNKKRLKSIIFQLNFLWTFTQNDKINSVYTLILQFLPRHINNNYRHVTHTPIWFSEQTTNNFSKIMMIQSNILHILKEFCIQLIKIALMGVCMMSVTIVRRISLHQYVLICF